METARIRYGPSCQGLVNLRSGNGEQRFPATIYPEDTVRDNAGDSRREKLLPARTPGNCKHFGGEACPGQRRTEDRADSDPMPAAISMRRSAGRNCNRFPNTDPDPAPIAQSNFCARLSRLCPTLGPGDDLDQRDPGPDWPLLVMVSGDGRIRAVSLGFGSKRVNEHTAQQSAYRWDQCQQPEVERMFTAGSQAINGSPPGRGTGQ